MLIDQLIAHQSRVQKMIGEPVRASRYLSGAHGQWRVMECNHDVERMGWEMVFTDVGRVDMPALGRAARVGIHHAAERMLGIFAEDGRNQWPPG